MLPLKGDPHFHPIPTVHSADARVFGPLGRSESEGSRLKPGSRVRTVVGISEFNW